MKWWCFNAEQLDAALDRYVEATVTLAEDFRDAAKAVAKQEIKAFLESDIAREHKLRGDNT